MEIGKDGLTEGGQPGVEGRVLRGKVCSCLGFILQCGQWVRSLSAAFLQNQAMDSWS